MGPGLGRGPGGGRASCWAAQTLLQPDVQATLGLTQQQADRIEQTDYDTQSRLIAKRAELEQAQLELRRLCDDPDIDRTALMTQIDRLGALRTELHKLNAGRLLDVRETLTPEQRQQARELIGQRALVQRSQQRPFIGGRRGAMRGGPGPGGPGMGWNRPGMPGGQWQQPPLAPAPPAQ